MVGTMGGDSREELLRELERCREEVVAERRRREALEHELRAAKQMTLEVQQKLEQEEECISNALMRRLEQLQQEKQELATEVERQESYLVNTLQRRLDTAAAEKARLESALEGMIADKDSLRCLLDGASAEKAALENQLEAEQEFISNKLQREVRRLDREKAQLQLQLSGLCDERRALTREKVDLEQQLEKEQEYILNKLSREVDQLRREKAGLSREKAELHNQVTALAGSVDRLNRDKVELEAELEAEEERVVNKLQRQLEHVTTNYKLLEGRLEAMGVPLRDVGLRPMDDTTEWVYGRSPSRSSMDRGAILLRGGGGGGSHHHHHSSGGLHQHRTSSGCGASSYSGSIASSRPNELGRASVDSTTSAKLRAATAALQLQQQ